MMYFAVADELSGVSQNPLKFEGSPNKRNIIRHMLYEFETGKGPPPKKWKEDTYNYQAELTELDDGSFLFQSTWDEEIFVFVGKKERTEAFIDACSSKEERVTEKVRKAIILRENVVPEEIVQLQNEVRELKTIILKLVPRTHPGAVLEYS